MRKIEKKREENCKLSSPLSETSSLSKSKLMGWLKKYSFTSAAYLSVNDNIKYFTTNSVDGYLGYLEHTNVAVVLGEPVCSEEDLSQLIYEFKSFCVGNKWQICFFGCSERVLKNFKERGFKILYIGAEPFAALDKFALTGRKKSSLRRGINHAKRVGVRVEECFSVDTNKVRLELEAVTKDWLPTKRTPELSFMVGRLSFDPEKRCFVARKNNQIIAFAVYNPIYAIKSYYLDLNRRMRTAPNGTMEHLIVSSFEKLRSEGVERVYLGLSPFSHAQNIENNPVLTKLMAFLYEHFDFFYPARSEYFFKQKLSTGYERRYMCYHPRASLRMLYAIFLSFCPGGVNEMFSYKVGRMLKRLR